MSAAPALPPKAGSPPILLCQVPGVDIKSRANSTSDSSSAISLLARLNSLLSRKNSLLCGKLWMHEHGPRGGDEINIAEGGKNYGWPVIGYGIDYSGEKINPSEHREG